jgi:hypothetical protein
MDIFVGLLRFNLAKATRDTPQVVAEKLRCNFTGVFSNSSLFNTAFFFYRRAMFARVSEGMRERLLG